MSRSGWRSYGCEWITGTRQNCTTSHTHQGYHGDLKYRAQVETCSATKREHTNTCSSPSMHAWFSGKSMPHTATDHFRSGPDTRTEERRWLPLRQLALDRARSAAHRMAVSSSDVGSTYFEHCTKHFEQPTCECCFAMSIECNSSRQAKRCVTLARFPQGHRRPEQWNTRVNNTCLDGNSSLHAQQQCDINGASGCSTLQHSLCCREMGQTLNRVNL